jgi:hypothetical protein
MSRPPNHSDATRIIELFARARPVYARADVLRLLGISDGQLASAITSGAVTEERTDTGVAAIPWEDVALLALEEWTPRMIEAALCNEAADLIPYANQHRLIQVSLPIHLIRLLDYLARFESATRHVPRNASDIIERVLHDHANTLDAALIEEEIPGFQQALTYPYFTPRADNSQLRCRYCTIAISEPTREVPQL